MSLQITDRRTYTINVTAPTTPTPTPGTVVIIDAFHPTSVTANTEVSWYVVAEVRNNNVNNPAVGYRYVDGPASSITIVDVRFNRNTLPKGQTLPTHLSGSQPPGTRIDSRNAYRSVIFPMAGTYTIELVAGILIV